MKDEMRDYRSQEARLARLEDLYIDDLREVLATPAGRRVLFRWLDRANTFGFVSLGGEGTIWAAAVSDYGRARVVELQEASPEGFIEIMRVGLDAMQAAAPTAKENGNA